MFRRPIPSTLCAWLVFTSFVSSATAGEVKPREQMEQPFHVTHRTTEHGLPQNRISALAQTPDGYLWVGTFFGLARFDGVRFVVFNSASKSEFKKEAVTALAVDRADGALWIGTREGLLRWKDGQFTRPSDKDGMSQWLVWRLTAAAGGGVWVDAGEHVVFYREGPSVVARIDLVDGEHSQAYWETEEQRLALATQTRLLRVAKDGKVSRWELPAGAPTNQWIAGLLPKDHAGRIWLSVHARLLRFADAQWHELQALPDRRSPQDHFLEDRAGGVWAALGGAGLWRYSEAGAEQIKLGESGAEKRITCMLEDIEGHVWVGAEQGLFKLRPRLIRAVTTAHGLPHDECWSVCEAPDGAIWVETKQGVARIEDEHAQTFPDEPGRHPRKSIFADREGRLWLGNGSYGLIVWRPGAEERRFWHDKPKVGIESFYSGRDGRVWVGTDQGVTWFENGQPAASWGEFGLPTNDVRSIYQTRDGTMWFGTRNAGVVRWKADARSEIRPAATARLRGENPKSEIALSARGVSAAAFTTTNGLVDDRVFVFHEDADGALWIGTHNGLSRFKDGHFFSFRTEQGLLDNLINWLEEDDFGQLWFSCNRGIFRIDRRELNAVADRKKARANVAVFGTADGMPSPETNGEHQPAGCKDREGRLWFPTQLGMVMIDPKMVEVNEVPPPVVIEQVKADDEVIFGDGVTTPGRSAAVPSRSGPDGRGALGVSGSLSPTRRAAAGDSRAPVLRLAPGSAKVLRIGYTANSFADSKRVRFRYRLDGSDRGWREETEERVAYYTNLRPGDYRFAVMAANAHGVWNETPDEFAFSLDRHFWETWPFYGLCIAGVVGLAGAVQAYRLRWQHRLLKLEEQRALANERARIARDLHDDLGTSLTGLALELDVMRRDARGAPPLSERLGETARRTRDLAEQMREVVWTVNPKCDTVSSLADFLEQQVSQFLGAAGIEVRLEFPEVIPALRLEAEVRHQLALGVREALTNVVRHAHATQVVISMQITGQLVVQIKDNGRGFHLAHQSGHGLENMRTRLEQIGGSFDCVSTPGAGSTVTFGVPLNRTSAA